MAFSMRGAPSQCHMEQLIVRGPQFYCPENQRTEFRATAAAENGGQGGNPRKERAREGQTDILCIDPAKSLTGSELDMHGVDSKQHN